MVLHIPWGNGTFHLWIEQHPKRMTYCCPCFSEKVATHSLPVLVVIWGEKHEVNEELYAEVSSLHFAVDVCARNL